ncbi:hypothetical protein EUX98_g3223 [Antrodiella citrinella]|uniref:CBM1 domain-containing protein n=1 Tax=Antrodiella citrinella TaxID=2447956 RepID=A0A4S4MX37_9APHY|nr:hypothetical protein EUX98_g3223 [Antrodiella citrinella]
MTTLTFKPFILLAAVSTVVVDAAPAGRVTAAGRGGNLRNTCGTYQANGYISCSPPSTQDN